MVVIVIIGILAAIAIPKLFGMTAKAKAQEVGPSAGTWVKLHQAYMTEYGKNGVWDSIGYTPPGQVSGNSPTKKGESTYFTYSENGAVQGTTGLWNGINDRGALGNGCVQNGWNATLTYSGELSEADLPVYTSNMPDDCDKLTPNFKNLGTTAGDGTDP
jgi:type II secretory pathway pseudopilin PulG